MSNNIKVLSSKEANAKWKVNDLHNDNISDGNLLDYQFNDMTFDNLSNPISHNGKDDAMSLFDIRNARNYGIVNENEMTHNNMVPYFKLKGNYGQSPNDEKHMVDTFNRKLNLFTGSMNNLDYRKKTERKPLFSPVPGLSNIYGSPVKTDQYQGRYIPGRERRNEKPFQEVKITPGLNLGYNEVGTQGFHDTYRALPRSIDETRTLNNPKITYNNPMGGKLINRTDKKEVIRENDNEAKYTNVNIDPTLIGNYESNNINGFYAPGGGLRSVDPVVMKRRPDKFKYYGNERLVANSAYQKKHANYGKVDPKNLATINRGTKDTTHTGIVGKNIGNVVKGKYEPTSKEQFKHDGPSNINGHKKEYVINYESITPDPTKRNLYNVNDRGNVNGHNQSYTINYTNAIPDPTNRNLYNIDDKGNLTGYDQSYTINYINATPSPTSRNLYNVNDKGNVSGYDQSYTINYTNATPDPTNRNMYNVNDKGNLTGYDQSYSINYTNATPAPTNRNLYNVNDKGNVNGYEQSYAINYTNATPSPTNRNLYNVNDKGNVSGYDQSYTINYTNATPDPTNRNMYNVNDKGNMSGYEQSYAINYVNATPAPTNRNMYNNSDSFRPASQLNQSYTINYVNATPDPTNRNLYNNSDSFKPAKGYSQNRSRMDANNMHQNICKDNITIKPHGPVKCNYNKIPTMENTIMTSSYNKLQINRELYPDIEQRVAGMDYPQIYDKKTLPNDEYHFNSYVIDNLQGNPYVNDTQLKSEYKSNQIY